MTDNDDELTGIFDDLTPEDFALEEKRGIVAFDRFVKENIAAIRMAYLASEGQVNPVAVLASPENEWTFVPTDDENLGEYIERLREAAKTLKATWFFISRKTKVGSYAADASNGIPDIADREVVKAARDQGILSEGIFYYAERYEDGVRDCRHGMMRADADDRLSDPIEGNPHVQGVGIFSNILS